MENVWGVFAFIIPVVIIITLSSLFFRKRKYVCYTTSLYFIILSIYFLAKEIESGYALIIGGLVLFFVSMLFLHKEKISSKKYIYLCVFIILLLVLPYLYVWKENKITFQIKSIEINKKCFENAIKKRNESLKDNAQYLSYSLSHPCEMNISYSVSSPLPINIKEIYIGICESSSPYMWNAQRINEKEGIITLHLYPPITNSKICMSYNRLCQDCLDEKEITINRVE